MTVRRRVKVALVMAGMLPALAAAQLPASFFASYVSTSAGLTPFHSFGFGLGPWQEYLARELTPDYLADTELPPLKISWLQPELVSLLPAFAEGLEPSSRSWTRYEFDLQSFGVQQRLHDAGSMRNPGLGFERQLLTSGVFQELGGSGLLGVEAIMAYQSYGSSRLGMMSMGNPTDLFETSHGFQPYQESAYGTGVRLNVSSPLAGRVRVGAGFQSRIDMEEFAHFRGVYASPADFDIPARASFDVAFQATERTSLNVSLERVMYSDVSAFPSRLLPARFLSLLGDSTSPNFAWDDLTVLKLGYTWSNGKDTQWRAELSSRSTPNPTSRSLQQALNNELADHAMLVGFSRKTGDTGRFNLNAAYAPADYIFGGNVLGVAAENLGQDFEVEAFWTWDF